MRRVRTQTLIAQRVNELRAHSDQRDAFRVDEIKTVSMGGYARATAIADAKTAKYQALDARLEKTAFDPAVPYFLDEEGSGHDVTGRRERESLAPPRRAWWKFWKSE